MAKKQADGRYRTKVTVGRYPDGKPIYKYASGKTKKELAAAVEEIKRRYIYGAAESRQDVVFGTYAVQWFNTVKKPRISRNTQDAYMGILRTHLLPAFGERQIRAISAMDVQEMLNSKAGYSQGTISKIHGCAQQIFRHAIAEGIITRDPTAPVTLPRGEKAKQRRALTAAETDALLRVAATHEHGLLLLVPYCTGMRIGEVLGLQWGDIDFAERVINVRRDVDSHGVGELKTAASRRTIPMPDMLVDALLPLRGVGSAFVFTTARGGYLYTWEMRRRWARLMGAMYQTDPTIEHEVLSVPRAKEPNIVGSVITPHYLRHNYASVLYASQVDVLTAQKWLGHSDPSTTMGIYTHLSAAAERADADKIKGVFAQKVAEKLPIQK